MDIELQDAIIELENKTAEFKSKTFETEEQRKQALMELRALDCFKIVEKFVGN